MQIDLSRIRVVLVNTSHPGNIGAVARAMKNMGLSQLYLVDPVEFPSGKARARASGATDVLEDAVVVATLDEAIEGCSVVMGASARMRTISWPTLDPRAAAERLLDAVTEGDAAIVMGRESNGLTNEELDKCHYLVHIPANPEYTSLNIAAATQVLVYELRMAALARQGELSNEIKTDHPLATAEEMERLYGHIEQTLIDIGFLDPALPGQVMRRLRRLYNRAHLDRLEVKILRGILTTTQQRCRRDADP